MEDNAREVNCLLDESASVRKVALCRIDSRIKSGNADDLRELGDDAVIKALLRRFSDPVEKCRTLAVSILLSLLQANPASVVPLLPYIVPVVSERMPLKSIPDDETVFKGTGTVETILVEHSEEVRLLLVQLLSSILDHAPRLIHPYASEVASIIMAAATDSFAEVLTEAMVLLEHFVVVMDKMIKPIAKQLTSVALRSLVHNRYKVRVAALRAIHRVVLCGGHEVIYELTAFQDPNLIPIRAFYHPYVKTQYLAVLARDKTSAVRKELVRTVSSWLLELDERKEHEVRLVPYVVSALNDQDADVCQLAFESMEEIGRQYEKENENEVKDMKSYLHEAFEDIPRDISLPALKHRPCLGARILVRSCFSLLLHAIGADLESWTSGTKELSANFLYTMLFFVEDNVTMHLEPLCALLVKACADIAIEKKILECATAVGYFVDPSAYLAIILPQLTGEVSGSVTIQHAGRTLDVLASLMKGSPSKTLKQHVPEICSTLTEQDLITSINWQVNQGIVRVCKCMVAAEGEEFQEPFTLLWLLLNAIAAAEFSSKPSENAESVLEDFAKALMFRSSEGLLARYWEELLSILPPPPSWIMRSLQPLIFCRLIRAAAAAAHAREVKLDEFLALLRSCGESSIDENIKLRVLLALEEFAEKTPEGNAQVAENLVAFISTCLKHGGVLSSTANRLAKTLSTKPWAETLVTAKVFF